MHLFLINFRHFLQFSRCHFERLASTQCGTLRVMRFPKQNNRFDWNIETVSKETLNRTAAGIKTMKMHFLRSNIGFGISFWQPSEAIEGRAFDQTSSVESRWKCHWVDSLRFFPLRFSQVNLPSARPASTFQRQPQWVRRRCRMQLMNAHHFSEACQVCDKQTFQSIVARFPLHYLACESGRKQLSNINFAESDIWKKEEIFFRLLLLSIVFFFFVLPRFFLSNGRNHE